MVVDTVLRPSFSGHETFPFRYTWLPKAVALVSEDPGIFTSDDAIVRLGVGKNMVKSIRHWGLASGVLQEGPPSATNRRIAQLEVSKLGERLFHGADCWDPYIENPATLWLLHWRLATNPVRGTTWHWVLNYCPQPEFTKDELVETLVSLAEQRGWNRPSAGSIKRDVDCFIRTYVPARVSRSIPLEDSLDCPLVELGLVREFGSRGRYTLVKSEHEGLPAAIVAYALIEQIKSIEASTIPLDAVAYAPCSPGRVFCLTEDGLLAKLALLEEVTQGAIVFDDTAGLRQILVRERPDAMELLNRYYQSVMTQQVGGAR